MRFLQMLTTALVFSYAKANPVEITLQNYHKHTPTTDSSDAVESYLAAAPFANPSAVSGTSLAQPTVTSLTRSYLEKRACIDQFAWYCAVPAFACTNALPAIATPPFTWASLVPCVLLAVCAGVALMIGYFCCTGTIPNCSGAGNGQLLSLAQQARPITGNVMAAFGGTGGASFTKQQFKDAFYGYLSSHGATAYPSDNDFNNFYTAFQYRAFCSSGPGQSGPSCTPNVISRAAMERYMLGQ